MSQTRYRGNRGLWGLARIGQLRFTVRFRGLITMADERKGAARRVSGENGGIGSAKKAGSARKLKRGRRRTRQDQTSAQAKARVNRGPGKDPHRTKKTRFLLPDRNGDPAA